MVEPSSARRLLPIFDDVSIFASSSGPEEMNIRPFTDLEASRLARMLYLCIRARRGSKNIGRKSSSFFAIDH